MVTYLKNIFLSDGAKHAYWNIGWFGAWELLNYASAAVSSGQLHLPLWAVLGLSYLSSAVSKELHNRDIAF